MAIITISRQMCSLGDEIAALLAKKLNARLVNRDTLLAELLQSMELPPEQSLLSESPKYYCQSLPGGGTLKELLELRLRSIAQNSSVVVVGMGAQAIFAKDPRALHIRAFASLSVRAERLQTEYHVSDEEAKNILTRSDRKHKRYVSVLHGIDSTDPAYYHLILNTDALCAAECAAAVLAMLEEHSLAVERPKNASVPMPAKPPVFKNSSEEEFARILDMYQMQWEYEPKTFPVEWDAEGNVTMAISPDFYLPRFDTYIEITTMNQKYVTTKNKKIRKLRELYPGIQIRIVYKSDFNALIDRFKTIKGAEE